MQLRMWCSAFRRCGTCVRTLQSVGLCTVRHANRLIISKSTATPKTIQTWMCASLDRLCLSLTAPTRNASVLSSPWEEAPKILVPAKCGCCSCPRALVFGSRVVPRAASVRHMVHEASACRMIFHELGNGGWQRVVVWYVYTCALCAVTTLGTCMRASFVHHKWFYEI